MDDARYFLDRDQSAHWYVIPLDRASEWDAWRDLPDDDEASWDAPAWARRVGGSPRLVTFAAPEVG